MHYNTEEKAKLLEDWKQSGKSISTYVKEKGLIRWTFTKWLKAAREPKACFVEVPTRDMKARPHQIPEILIEKGEITIHIPLGMNCGELRTIMESLGVTP